MQNLEKIQKGTGYFWGCRKIIKLGDGAIPSLHLKENGSDSTLFCGLLPFLSIL